MQMLAKGRSKRIVRDLIDDTVSNYHELFLLTDDEAWNKLPKLNRLTNEQRDQALRDLYAAPLPTDKRFIKARSEDLERFQILNAYVWRVVLRPSLSIPASERASFILSSE
jgi:hypothetical protein